MRLPFAALGLVFLPSLLTAQDRDPREVMPERPTVATHAFTVAPGIFEVESGVERDRFDAGSSSVTWTSNLKLGLASHVQLNLLVPVTGASAGDLGAGDMAVGIKWRVLDRHPLLGSVAILPAVKFATAAGGRGTGTTDVSLTLISSRQIGPVSIDLNLARTERSGDGTAAPKHALLWTASFGGPLIGSAGWVFEWYGYPTTTGPAGSRGTSALLFGPTFEVNKRLVLDAGVILPLAGPQRDGIYAGLTWNVTRL